MACGVYLGILLVCLVQAEHVCCFWVSQDWSSQGGNGNRYVGSLQQDSGLKRLGNSDSQNQFRQASVYTGSAQSSGFSAETGANSGHSQKSLSSGSMQSGHSSVRFMLMKPDSEQVNAQMVSENHFSGPSASVASGSSICKNQNQNDLQLGTRRTSSSCVLARRPSEKGSSSHLSAAQISRSAAAETRDYNEQRRSLPSAKCSGQQRDSVSRQTSATVLGRRVSPHRSSEASKRSRFPSAPNDGSRPNQHKWLPVTGGGNPLESYYPMFGVVSSPGSDSKSLPSSLYNQNGVITFDPLSRYTSTDQTLGSKPSSTSGKIPSTKWAQGTCDLPDSGHRASKHFSPTWTYRIPQPLGGYDIRRLRKPGQEAVSRQKPQQPYTRRPPPPPLKPQQQRVPHPVKWVRVKLNPTP